MKKIKYKLLAASLLVLLFGCDLDTTPTTSVNEKDVYETLEKVEYVINGTWAYVWETRNTYASPGWSTLMLVSDFMGNDVVETGKYGYSDVYKYTAMTSGTSTQVVLIWRLAYKAIDNMNNIIKKIDDIYGDDAYRARLKAQAYAFRGYMYLNLASYYAGAYSEDPNQPCVPIYTEPTDAKTEGKSRSTLAQVYTQAENDLREAYKIMGTYTRSAKYKIDKNVVAGLLARVCLHTEKWEDAGKYAALAHEGYNWMPSEEYLAGFNNLANAEWIWGQGTASDQSAASESFDYKDVSSKSSGYYSMMADPYFMDLFDEDDVRFQLFQWDESRSKGYLMYKKFRFKDNGIADIVIMRKAEMVLIEAEALAEQGDLNGAIAKLNTLRIARGAQTPELSGLSKEDLVEEILIERRKELFGEGFALADLKRREKSLERKAYADDAKVPGTEIPVRGHSILRFPNGTDFVANSSYYLFVIPATEYTNNPNL